MSQLTELQEYLKVLSKQIEFKDQVNRLLENPDFKSIILEGFCKDEMTRCMQLAVSDRISPDLRDVYLQMAKSSATLENYLNTLIVLGTNAVEDKEEVSQQIESLLVNGEE